MNPQLTAITTATPVQVIGQETVVRVEQTPVIYPDSDGKPMADNTEQFKWIVLIKENLEIVFVDREDVFVAGDLLWYPVSGNNKIRQAPDALVVFGRPKGKRGSYQQWKEENIPPQVVFEVLSPGNRPQEMKKKLGFYRKYGVEEYYIYDPDRRQFKGYQRDNQGSLRLIRNLDNWSSPRLGIKFSFSPGSELVIYQPNGERFLSPVELKQGWRKTEAEKLELEKLLAIYRERFGDLPPN